MGAHGKLMNQLMADGHVESNEFMYTNKNNTLWLFNVWDTDDVVRYTR